MSARETSRVRRAPLEGPYRCSWSRHALALACPGRRAREARDPGRRRRRHHRGVRAVAPGLAGSLREHHRVPGRLAARRQGGERARPARAHRGARPAPVARLLRKRLPRDAGLLCGAGPPAGRPARALGRRVQEVEPRRARGRRTAARGRTGPSSIRRTTACPAWPRADDPSVRHVVLRQARARAPLEPGRLAAAVRRRAARGASRPAATASARCATGSRGRSRSWRIGRATPAAARAWPAWSPPSRWRAPSSPSRSDHLPGVHDRLAAPAAVVHRVGARPCWPAAWTWTTACTASGSSSRSSWRRSAAS